MTGSPKSTARGRGLAQNLLLAALAASLPLLLLELVLRPFVDLEPEVDGIRPTTLFVRDAELGWKLRPGAEDVWGGVRVRINAKGLRGPELDYAKPPGVTRILYLGDSVPFGFKIASHERTFPYRIAAILERRTGARVETVNTGVGGYSPWQTYRVLAGEGVRYQPDVVVLSFVLNDVTEKFDLIRFGGSSEGHQLARSVRSRLDRLLDRTAIGHVGRRLVARVRFGADVRRGAAELAALRAHQLALEPDRPEIHRAWQVTLENVERIFALCRERDIPALLVAFPYSFQLDDVERFGAPQRVLRRFAADNRVPLVDLLPAFAERIEAGASVDEDHPSVRGHALAAAVVAEKMLSSGWLGESG